MNKDQIKHMVDRFLMWRLPKPWNPDNGISYKRPNYMHAPADHDWPVGTNLFDAEQATAMVQHMIDGLPDEGADRLANIQVRCPQFGVASDDYLNGFEAGAHAVIDAIRNRTNGTETARCLRAC